ncbi:MAG: bifunctional UDP-N-acetylglucosamine diphosphorylase/glucosamine-1-phosphate N-acetyltransferase GlmU [Halobacteriovoraceae bacterium]|jgi:bifunctional UDP-N-acetylglucosamine pyrophosphorylase / glucosamine-1-phosphate N-acetyltransferase|nr:bifunctional UDP-N-acetylglucosamine diphosphorylase/glucosamine-1-phosphate N-acetyltransferase GlmU [Halobacteriovoraceae bacterium]
MSDIINTVILAAGKGTRLNIDKAKPLCPAMGQTLVDFVIQGIEGFSEKISETIEYNFVVGHEKEKVLRHITENYKNLSLSFAHQKEQLGTGHALQTFFESNPKAWGNEYTLVVCADTPLITSDVYLKLFDEIKDSNFDAVCACFITGNPTGYGRIEQKSIGFNIVEEKDATDQQKEITAVNSALYFFKTSHIKNYINQISNKNNSNELYLTDLFKEGFNVKTVSFSEEKLFLGVNNLVQLEEAESVLLQRKMESLMLSGVIIKNAKSQYIETQVDIKPKVVIYPNVSLKGKTTIASGAILEEGVIINNSEVGAGVKVRAYSYLEGAKISDDAVIGPMARLREGTIIEKNCKVGNFVEIKKAVLHEGSKVSHLSYVGDAQVGENTNIGCGFITCNYDGANKHKTIIGKNSFIGSDCQMIAPVTIGDEAYVGSGSTINKDVPDHAFAIARQRQVNKENMASRFIKKK